VIFKSIFASNRGILIETHHSSCFKEIYKIVVSGQEFAIDGNKVWDFARVLHGLGLRPAGICDYKSLFPMSQINPIIQYSTEIISGESIVEVLTDRIDNVLKTIIKHVSPDITDDSYASIKIAIDSLYYLVLDGNYKPKNISSFINSTKNTVSKTALRLYIETNCLISGVGDCLHAALNSYSNILHMMATVVESNTSLISWSSDFRHHGMYADTISFEYINCVKSIVSGLDQLAKILSLYIRLSKKQTPRIEDRLASDLSQIIAHNPNFYRFKTRLNKLKYLMTMRNELTHNRSLSMFRYPVFLGINNSLIKLKNTVYCDALTWDRESNGKYARFEKLCGFVSQQRCAVAELQGWIRNSYWLIVDIYDYIACCCPH